MYDMNGELLDSLKALRLCFRSGIVPHWCTIPVVSVLVGYSLSRVALGAQRPIVVKLSRERSVGPYVRTYVRPSVCPLHCGTSSSAMAERPRELDQRFQVGSI